MKFSKIFSNIISIINIIIYSIFFFFFKITKKKIVIFYFGSVGSYQNHLLIFNKSIKRAGEDSCLVKKFIIYDIFIFKYFYKFINIKHIQFLNFSDIIIVNHPNKILPKNTVNVLIPHDIYDTFVASATNCYEKEDSFLYQYSYILCSGEATLSLYKKKINYLKLIKKPKLLDIGYFKLDYLLEVLNKKKKLVNNKILILAGNNGLLCSDYIYRLLDPIIINFPDKKIIYRPHPGHYKYNFFFYQELIRKYKNSNFIIDLDPIYLKSFIESEFMITEYSSSAYTYAFSTLKPVLLITASLNSYMNSTYYIRDARKIGFKYNIKKNNLIYYLNKIVLKKDLFKLSILKLRKKRISNLNNSFNIFRDFLKKELLLK